MVEYPPPPRMFSLPDVLQKAVVIHRVVFLLSGCFQAVVRLFLLRITCETLFVEDIVVEFGDLFRY